MKLQFRLWTLILLIVAAGCASAGAQRETSPRRTSNIITAEEIRTATASNAYELVQMLRPGWLRTRGAQSIYNEGTIMVYYDQVRLGGPEALRSIPINAVTSLQFIDAASATQRWGTGHSHGAILVSSQSGRQ